VRFLVLLVALAACGDELDPPWELDHNRIIAVRATPPAILSGEQATLDALLSLEPGVTAEVVPEAAMVVSPASLMTALSFDGTNWIVTAPDEAALASARAELGIEAGMPVPLQVGVVFNGQTLIGLKNISLGTSAPNPVMPALTFAGTAMPPAGTELVIPSLEDVPMSAAALETDEVNWLTSCGEMHDFDLPNAYVRVEVDSSLEGELAVVLRDERGGVTWQTWPMRADPPPPMPSE
jgi:hypothetical protein